MPQPEEQKTKLEIVKPTSIENISLPHRGERNSVIGCVENLEIVLKALNITARYNVISKEDEILIPGKSFSVDNKSNASLTWIISTCAKLKMPLGNIPEFVNYLADQNLYNPVTTWITSKPWDRVTRLEEFYATVVAKGEKDPECMALKKTLIMKWLVSAVAGAFRPNGISAHGVLVFQGKQDIGKTYWFKKLVPAELQLIADGKTLNPSDRDSVKQVVSYWLVELGELDATFKKSDIAQLKSFITRDKDVIRRAFARKESEYARRTIFFASVNPDQFLNDDTGNKRFWTIACEKINFEHSIDMQQLWAEVYEELYLKGMSWYLTREEFDALNRSNEFFENKDPIEERINTDLDWAAKEVCWQWQTATQVLNELGYGNPKLGDIKKAKSAIMKLNGAREKKTTGVIKMFVPLRRIKDLSNPSTPYLPFQKN